jgi:hypothetical protein
MARTEMRLNLSTVGTWTRLAELLVGSAYLALPQHGFGFEGKAIDPFQSTGLPCWHPDNFTAQYIQAYKARRVTKEEWLTV